MNIKPGKLLLPAAVSSVAAAARIYYECRHFKTEYYTVASKKIPRTFDGYRFVLVSDLHNYDFDQGNVKLLHAIDDFRPDAVMVAGDMINAVPGADMETAIAFIQDLCRRWPVYFGNGNHEQRISLYPETYSDMNLRWREGIRHPNLHLLRNDHLRIWRDKDHINIYGLEMNRRFYKRFHQTPMPKNYMLETLGRCDKKDFNLLIAHNPFYFKEYSAWGADLVLSGHVHGGVVILPFLGGVISPQVRLFPKYYAGHYKQGSSQMILSRGLHMHSFRIRLFNMPELACITLRRSGGHENSGKVLP